jgi:hypothetical protein
VGTLRWLLLAAIAPASGLGAAPAAACVLLPIICLGKSGACNPSPLQKLAEERNDSAAETRRRLAEGKARLRAGKVDPAAELAELLVPNIRPVWVEMTSCGPMGEVDYGDGNLTWGSLYRSLVAGTPLAGKDPEFFAALLDRSEAFPLEPPCNAEFRKGFAAYIERSVPADHLRQAWLFLSARQRPADSFGDRYHRLVRFEGGRRAPPVRWTAGDRWLEGQIARALARTAWGRSLTGAMDAFWAEAGGRVGENERACPVAFAEWARVRERVVAEMIAMDAQHSR